MIENGKSQIGHADFVDIRKYQCDPDIDLIQVFSNHIDFIADIPARLGDAGKYLIEIKLFDKWIV